MSDCDNRIACCPPDPFSYSLVNYPVVTNEELTFFIPCPDGFTCLYEMYEVTIPAGEIEYRPTTPDEDTTAKIQEIAESRARARGYAAMQPTPKTYQSDAITVSCGEGAIGDLVVSPSNPFVASSSSVLIPAGMFSSTVSKVAANALATAFANSILAGANCHWENTEQTVECPLGTTGGPFTVPAGDYSSTVSQADADAQALAAAESQAESGCVPACPNLGLLRPAIVGYTDSMFTSCVDCADANVLPAWDGIFHRYGNEEDVPPSYAPPCSWTSGGDDMSYSLNGGASKLTRALIYFQPLGQFWEVLILCYDPINLWSVDVWYGFTADGQSTNPNGIVIPRDHGCSAGPASITISLV